jgi:hypothetical protein
VSNEREEMKYAMQYVEDVAALKWPDGVEGGEQISHL